MTNRAVAITGMGLWAPGASELGRFWENTLARRREFREFPDCRMPLADYWQDAADSDGAEDKTYADRAALIDDFTFDWAKRRIPETTFRSTDIAHWLALEVALKALDDAGYTRQTVPTERSAALIGNSLTGDHTRSWAMRLRWPFVRRSLRAAAESRKLPDGMVAELEEAMEDYFKSPFSVPSEDTLTGVLSNTIAGRICNYLDFRGGGYVVDGACSSGLLAVATAAKALSSEEIDFALAGGVDVSLDPMELVGFARLGALTRGDMNVYDKRASGFIPGEGCGVVALKRLEDARRDGDYVYACIRGWGISSDGKGGITQPHAETQAVTLHRAYECAGVAPDSVSFIEGHGTATPVGDPAELQGMQLAVDPAGALQRPSIGVTSLKTLIGHTKAASGILALIKTAMAVNRRVLPPMAGCGSPNRIFREKATALFPIVQGEQRDVDAVVRAGVQAMGFGGINCHAVLESVDPPSTKLDTSLDERALMASHQENEVIVLTASSVHELVSRAREVEGVCGAASVAELTDLAAKLANEVDIAAPIRAAVVAGRPKELRERLRELVRGVAKNPPSPGELHCLTKEITVSHSVRHRVGYVFPGQGAQQLGMARNIVERCSWARQLVSDADEWLVQCGARPVSSLIWRDVLRARDDDEVREWNTELTHTEVTQPAIALAALLWVKYLRSLNLQPSLVAGHSLGELVALHVAGAYDERALIELAAAKGRAMANPSGTPGTMASLGCGNERAQSLIAEVGSGVEIANINAPQQVVVAGTEQAIDAVVRAAQGHNVPCTRLNVSNAFHSSLMERAREDLLENMPLADGLVNLALPVFSCVSGERMEGPCDVRALVADQVVSRVDWHGLVKAASHACDYFVEVGPGRVLTGLIKATNGASCVPVASRPDADRDLNAVLAAAFTRGADIDWRSLYADRLVRPFVAATERLFIRNPAEAPLTPSKDYAPSSYAHAGPGDAAQALRDYLDERGQFLVDVIRADIGATAGPPRDRLEEARADAHGSAPEPPPSNTPDSDAPRDSASGDTDIASVLFGVVAELTGFEADSLTLDLKLIDDLNLDSIKAAEAISKVWDRLGINDDTDPSELAAGTLADIVRAAVEASSAVEIPVRSEPDTHSPWVRSFVVDPTVMRLGGGGVKHLEGSVLVVAEDSEAEIRDALRAVFTDSGSDVATSSFDDVDPDRADHVIAVLPADLPQQPVDVILRTVQRLRSVVPAQSAQVASLTLVQFGGALSLANERGSFAVSSADAFAASVHHERPNMKIRVLDFARQLPADAVAERVADELGAETSFASAGYDHEGSRRVPRARVVDGEDFEPRSRRLDSDDVVVITGGAKGITAECALALAETCGASVALVGTTPQAMSDEVNATLRRFAERGLTARYFTCDVTDPGAVQGLLRTVANEIGLVTAIVHGAGLNQPKRVEETYADMAFAEIAPKAVGAINLMRASEDLPLKLFIGISSIIGVTGMPGNCWYALGNQMLDSLIREAADRRADCTMASVAYSVWGETGMGARLGSIGQLAKMGVGSIPTAEGVRHFVRLLDAAPEATGVVVAGRLGGLDTWYRQGGERPEASCFLERLVHLEPDVELVAETTVSGEEDYIQDHVWKGSALFPTVFGLEAMAQGVRCVTGHPLDRLRIENVVLRRPIIVERDAPTRIRIEVQVCERSGSSDEVRVLAAVRSSSVEPEFSAQFVLGGTAGSVSREIPAAAAPLDIDPLEHLYGGLLFQGPRYQRLRRLYSLDSQHCRFDAEVRNVKGEYVLGDPYFLDALLQSGQVVVPQEICLPVSIGAMELRPERFRDGIVDCLVHEKVAEDDQINAKVVAVVDGRAAVELTDYRSKILERWPDNPTPEELAKPAERDKRLIEAAAADHGVALGIAVPDVTVWQTPEIHALPRHERHVREQPVFAEVIEKAAARRREAT